MREWKENQSHGNRNNIQTTKYQTLKRRSLKQVTTEALLRVFVPLCSAVLLLSAFAFSFVLRVFGIKPKINARKKKKVSLAFVVL